VAVAVAPALAKGDGAARAGGHDAITLDLTGREEEALAVLARWRRDGLRTPVLVLTAGHEPGAGVRALETGADTFLPRSIAPEALLAHLRALLRLPAVRAACVLRAFDLEIDTEARLVRRGGRLIALSPREYALLELLARRQGRVVSRAEILRRLYGCEARAGSNVVEVYVRYLRTKIDLWSELPLILTRRGEGYLLRGEEDQTRRKPTRRATA
jgi:DNA-binding response OmpR family regulator